MKKRVISIVLSVALILGNLSGLEIGAAANEQTAEVNAITLTEPEEEQVWTCVDGVIYVPEGIARLEDGHCRYIGGEGWFPDAKKIVLPSTLEYIGDNAFEMCELEEIVIPGNVKEIGDDAFWCCDNLKKVVIEDGVEKMGCALFRDCSNLETVILPKAVKEWNTECAFYGCKIKNITLPEEGLTTLGSGMFAGCPLEELNIPDCVTTMNYGVTLECTNLKKIRAGYSVVNFEDGNPRYDLYNFTKGCFGGGCSNMVLEAPLDSAIVEYARDYRYFTVKYDYPDFERMEWICDGKIPEDDTSKWIDIKFEYKVYPEETRIGGMHQEDLTKNVLQEDGYSCLRISNGKLEVSDERTSGRAIPAVHYFSETYTTQDENLEYTVEHTDYFRIIITEASWAEKRVQVEILKSGERDSEDAEWELLTPAIDTTVLTPTPTAMPTKAVTLTATVTPEPEKITTEVPTVTAAPTSKPAITKKVIPTPCVKVVKPAKTSIKSAKQNFVKKQGKKTYKKEVKLSWKKVKNADGYVIYMKTGTGKYKAVKNITNGKTVSCTKKNLKKGKTYYFKIRAYRKANGQKVYGSYSGVKKIKIR